MSKSLLRLYLFPFILEKTIFQPTDILLLFILGIPFTEITHSLFTKWVETYKDANFWNYFLY